MDEYVVKETTLWGDYQGKSVEKRLLYLNKLKVRGEYPWFTDHPTFYAYKPKSQRGPARESQQFMVSYPYCYDDKPEIIEREKEFVKFLSEMDLRFYKEDCTFRGHPAHKILIMERDVDLNAVLTLIPLPK
jgi:hypothetical protein